MPVYDFITDILKNGIASKASLPKMDELKLIFSNI
jgi:hypothetical protein